MMRAQNGFTLIELSIVLVVIGLVIGGIMVGQDLMAAAKVRGTIAQIEKYNAAVNVFKGKYGYIPGDMPPLQTSQLNFFTFTGGTAGTTGYGDGDGRLINSLNFGPPGFLLEMQEAAVFWRHLSEAQLIDGNFGTIGNAALVTSTGAPAVDLKGNDISLLIPQAKLGRTVYISVFAFTGTSGGARAFDGTNYFLLSMVNLVSSPIGSGPNRGGPTPTEAYAIDSKMDDGDPRKGSVIDETGLMGTGIQGLECTNASGQYDISNPTYANTQNCMLAIHFQ